MFWHLVLTPLIFFLNSLYSALPPWTLTIGTGAADGQGAADSIDHSYIHYGLVAMRPFDKFVPLHDGVLPLVLLGLAFFVALNAFKAMKFVLSLIPTISAGG